MKIGSIDTDDFLAPRGRPTGEPTLVDRVRLDIRREVVRDTAAYLLSAPTPDEAAKSNKLARRFGIDALLIDGTLEGYEKRRQIEDFTAMALRFSGLSAWASQPRNAAVAIDDSENLGLLGSTWQSIKNVGSSLKAGSWNALGGLGNMNAAFLEDQATAARAAWDDPNSDVNKLGLAEFDKAITTPVLNIMEDLQRYYEGTARESIARADAARPQVENRFARDFLMGVESVPSSLTALAVGAATRSPSAAAGFMSLPVAGNAYRDARDKGLNPEQAMDYAIVQGGVEYLTEKMPASLLLRDIASKSPVGKMLLGQLMAEIPSEQAATFLQDLSTWATLNPEKSLADWAREQPDRQLSTLIATISGVGGTVGTVAGVQKSLGASKALGDRLARSRQAQEEGELLDAAADAALKSKVRERDPDAFKALNEALAEESPNGRIYIPAEEVITFMQSDSYDGSFDAWSEQVYEAEATGGDVVIPIAEALSTLVGTEGWKATRPSMRLSPGGQSQNEAQSFEEALADVMVEFAEEVPEALTGRDALFQSIADKLMDAGYTPAMARVQAELLTSRYATRQANRGRHVAGDEFAGVTVTQILPEKVALAQKASGLDRVIDAIKRNTRGESVGPSLLEFIAKRGGIDDPGGDIASMGGETWHKGKPGTRKLVKPVDRRQVSMLATDGPRDTSAELVLRAAISAGYFPELAGHEEVTYEDAIDTRVLLDAIGEELSGKKRFAKDPDTTLSDGAAQLEQLLRERDIDPAKATRKEITAAVDAYAAEQTEGRRYEQPGLRSQIAEAWDGKITKGFIDLGPMPSALVEYGLPDVPLQMGRGKIRNIALKHDIEMKHIVQLSGLLEQPWAIYPSTMDGSGRVVAALRVRDGKGSPIVVIIEPSGTVSVVNSMYGKSKRGAVTGDEQIIQAIANAKAKGENVFEGNAPPALVPESISGMAPRERDRTLLAPREKGKDGGQALEQEGENEPRGRIIFPSSGFDGFRAAIELFQSRDLSTFMHESAHLWLEELRFDANDPDAIGAVRADWEIVQRWFAENGHPVVDGVIPVEAHEMWARGVERYLMEGKAPTSPLGRIFETVKTWLTNKYRSVLRLNSPVTDEIRGVMDRLLATEDELKDAARRQSIELMFEDATAAGMTEEEFAGLRDLAEAGRRRANDALLAKVMAPIRARVTKEHKARAAVVREEVAADVDQRPVFRAVAAARGNPIDADWIRERMGEDVVGRLPRFVPPLVKNGGANPADVAEMAGFGTPQEMVEALLGMEVTRKEMREAGDSRSVRQALIEQETDRIMNERYGDPFTDGSIEDEALGQIHNDVHGEVMAAELRVLARSTGRTATPYRVAREWARTRVRGGIVNDVASLSAIQRYQRAAAKAGREAMDAAIAGDRETAFRAKQKQMINNALVSEAKKAQEDIETALARLEKVAKRRTSPSIDQDYLERAQALLEQVDLRTRSQANIRRQAQFEEWANAQTAEGVDIVVPPSFAASIGTTHWSRLAVEEFLGLDAAVAQIIHLGKLKQKLLDGQEQRAFDATVSEATDLLADQPQKPVSDLFEPTWFDNVKSGIASADVALLKIETLVDWLDNGNSNGVFNRVVFKPIADAQDRENDMRADYQQRLGDILAKLTPADLKRWSETVPTPELTNRRSGNAWKGNRSHLVAMALNVGNAGNLQRLADGYGWAEANVLTVLNRELTESDWLFVQEVWDMVDTLWPEIAAMERRVNGIAPDKVEAVPVETPFGVLRGGYYPAIYDSSKNYNAERNAEKAADLFSTKYTRATTRASSTKDRSEKVSQPILLSLGVINRHIGEVIHDITHREAIMQAAKFLSDGRIKSAIDDTLGPEYRKAFTPWLKFVANQWAHERAGNEGIGAFMTGLRSNTTVVGMGWRATTVIMQLAGYASTAEVIGAEWVAKGAALSAANPIDTFNMVMQKSGEIRYRMNTLDRDINATINKMAGSKNPLTAAKRFAFHGIGYMDRIVSIPTWLGAYNKALHEGMTDEQAVYAADKAVRQSQGSASAKDLAAVATGQGQWGQGLKLLTLFYSFVSSYYQRQRTLGRDARRAKAKDMPGIVARAWWLIVVAPLLPLLLTGRGPGDDEDWFTWAFKNMLFQQFSAIPIARDAARPLYDKLADNPTFDYQLSPIQRALQTIIDGVGIVPEVVSGDETTNATRTIMEAVGYATGLVPGQIAQSTQFLVDVGYGEQDPQNFWQWLDGLSDGKIED